MEYGSIIQSNTTKAVNMQPIQIYTSSKKMKIDQDMTELDHQ